MISSSCDVEVQVNEEHTFLLRQKPLATYSGRMSRILKRNSSSRNETGLTRILLHDFPGGAEAFELAARFCYNNGRIPISNSNVSLLRCVAEFLDMTEAFSRGNLVKLTEMHLQSMGSDWDSNLAALRGCQNVVELAEKAHIVHRCADALASRICSSCLEPESSPISSSSPDSYRFHSGSISRGSTISSSVARTWWFSDVASLPVLLMERVIKPLIYNDVDNKVLARFLIYYLRSALPVQAYTRLVPEVVGSASKVSTRAQLVIFELIVNLLFHLERGSASCRFLFSMLRVSSGLNASRACRRQLEKMIGSQLHEASLDNILMPLYPRSSSLYDVDLVIRLVEYFFREQDSSRRIKEESLEAAVETPATRVGELIDCYLAEIAPDIYLKPHKFRRLAQSLPAFARWNHDELYRAVDSFLEAHHSAVESEVNALCKTIDVEKLSFEVCKHAAKNPRLPARFVLEVLAFQQGQLRDCFLKDKECHRNRSRRRSGSGVWEHVVEPGRESQLRVDLQEMQCKVSELEKACKNMRSDVTKYNRAARRLMC